MTFHGGDATKETHYRPRLVPRVYARRLAALQREAAMFVCVSEFVRDRLLERGFPRDKLQVIYQGVETDTVGTAAAAPGDPYVLFVGRFVEKKGVRHLIEAVRLLAAHGTPARLVLIGDGPLTDALREQAAGLSGVDFLGWLPNTEVRRRMRGAVALCVPSVTAADGDAEGLSTVIFEAMAEGTPVVATRHAGIAEAVEDGRTGLLVPEGDPPALADALASLITHPERRRQLGSAGRIAAAERFGAIGQSRRLEAALLRVIANAPPPCRRRPVISLQTPPFGIFSCGTNGDGGPTAATVCSATLGAAAGSSRSGGGGGGQSRSRSTRRGLCGTGSKRNAGPAIAAARPGDPAQRIRRLRAGARAVRGDPPAPCGRPDHTADDRGLRRMAITRVFSPLPMAAQASALRLGRRGEGGREPVAGDRAEPFHRVPAGENGHVFNTAWRYRQIVTQRGGTCSSVITSCWP